MRGVCHAPEGLSARDREPGILGVGHQHKRPLVEPSVSEREEIVVHSQQTIPAAGTPPPKSLKKEQIW